MVRFILYLLFILAVSIVGTWLFENNGSISLDWLGYRLETTITFASIFAIAFLAAFIACVEILLWVKNAPRKITDELAHRRVLKGYATLSEGFTALIEGDVKKARTLGNISLRLLPTQPYPHLLIAETAKINQDYKEADKHFASMLGNSKTETAALKGLVDSFKRQGNISKAINFAKRAKNIRSSNDWATDALIDLYKRNEDWEEVRNLTRKATSSSPLRFLFGRKPDPQRQKRIHDYAIFTLMQAKKEFTEGNIETAYSLAEEAYKIIPEFMPCITLLANISLIIGKKSRASRLIRKAWQIKPNQELAEIYLRVYDDNKLEKKLKRLKQLYEINPDSIESKEVVARFAVHNGLFNIAGEYLESALKQNETASLLKLMAQYKEHTGAGREEINQYIKKAEFSEPKHTWVCSVCNSQSEEWSGVCGECKSFDSYVWDKSGRTRFFNDQQKEIEKKRLAVH